MPHRDGNDINFLRNYIMIDGFLQMELCKTRADKPKSALDESQVPVLIIRAHIHIDKFVVEFFANTILFYLF